MRSRRSSARGGAVAAALLALVACGPSVQVMRHGAARPARPTDCKLRFATELDPQTVTLRYKLLGHVVVSGGAPGSPKIRELVRERACALGGKLVVPGAAIGTAGGTTETFLVIGGPRSKPLTIGEAMSAGAAGLLTVAKSSKERIVVAVFDLDDRTERLDRTQLAQLSEYLATRIAQQPGFSVTPRDKLRARLARQRKASYRACHDSSCQIEIGKILAAQKSLSTHLLRVGDGCALAAKLYDLRSETTERAATVPCGCEPGKALLATVDALVARLVAR